ncbi:hypothetical protein [Amycolatopsis benzoatilytica]|uniref:hypothetical protein n=1 Tax=Amycolatopsis benzoatilytica TaxID=346045 RepID=UPI0003731479|nr:hypothetical protein [Amycolatopsis benzoatilytica]
MTERHPDQEQTANPRRTQIDNDEERPPRRPEPKSELEDEEGRSRRGHPRLGENFRGEN